MTISEWLFVVLVTRWVLLAAAVIMIGVGVTLSLRRFVQRVQRQRRVRQILRRSRPIQPPVGAIGQDIHAEKRRAALARVQSKNCVLDDLRIESR